MDKSFTTIEELISEPSFLNWFLQKEEQSRGQWEAFAKKSEINKKLVADAVSLLHQLEFSKDAFDPSQIQKAWDQLAAQLPEQRKTLLQPGILYRLSTKKWWISAAAVLLLIAGIGISRFFVNDIKVATTYGQITEQKLPDGSVVLLNANSHITTGNFKEGKTREVWLEGEAFFKVHKTLTKDRFIVHTGKLDIEVTGTQFNVVNRNNHMNVFLKEGSVTLRTGDGTEAKMKPGDYFELKNSRLEKKPVKDQLVLAWQDRKLIFENTPLNEVAEKMKEVYGVNVQVDPSLTKRIDGILPNDDLDGLLQALELAYNFKIEHVKNTIVISPR